MALRRHEEHRRALFQSAPPRTGAICGRWSIRPAARFNPRPRARGRCRGPNPPLRGRVSIRAPAHGGDTAARLLSRKRTVSIRAPAHGGDRYVVRPPIPLRFQSAPPRTGAIARRLPPGACSAFQSAPPRTGAIMVELGASNNAPFQSAPPRTGAISVTPSLMLLNEFQSAPPRTGAMVPGRHALLGHLVSIRAPAHGGDEFLMV